MDQPPPRCHPGSATANASLPLIRILDVAILDDQEATYPTIAHALRITLNPKSSLRIHLMLPGGTANIKALDPPRHVLAHDMSFHLYHDSSLDFSSPPTVLLSPEMPMSPDLLAAVGNITIGELISPKHRSSLLPDHACYPINGLTRNSVTSIRTFKVLDALASLSVSRKDGEVISIGLQLDIEANTITITVSENDAVGVGTTQYVSTIWTLLRDLSNIYANDRARYPGADVWQEWGGSLPRSLIT